MNEQMKRSLTRKWIAISSGIILAGSMFLTSCSGSGTTKKTARKPTKKTSGESAEDSTDEPTEETSSETTKETNSETTKESSMDPENKKVLRFSSFDGGGFSYTVTIDDPSIVTYDAYKDYGGQDPGEVDGASFDYTVELIPLSSGTTKLTVKGESPIMDPEIYYYQLTVGDDLSLQVTQTEEPDQETTDDSPEET